MKLATDIGGTFADLVYLDDTTGSIGTSKSSSTLPNFAQGILDTVTKAEIDAQAVEPLRPRHHRGHQRPHRTLREPGRR